MQKFTHQHFGSVVFAFNTAHVVAALLFGMYIGHVIKLHYTGQTYKVLPGCIARAANLPGM